MVESEIARGIFISRAEAEKITLTEALERYQRDVFIEKKSRRQVESQIRMLSRSWIGAMSLAAITSSAIAKFRDARAKQGAAPQTVRHDLSLLSRVFNTAAKEWGIYLPAGNPVAQVRIPRIANARTRRLVDNEEARLRSGAQTYGGEIGPILTWAIETAMRHGEIAAMHWAHVDRKAQALLIPETKTRTPAADTAVHQSDGGPGRTAPPAGRAGVVDAGGFHQPGV